jgi:hypothetical protein
MRIRQMGMNIGNEGLMLGILFCTHMCTLIDTQFDHIPTNTWYISPTYMQLIRAMFHITKLSRRDHTKFPEPKTYNK